MPTLSPKVTPYYGGGQVVNPANVVQVTSAPTTTFTQDNLGTIQVDYTNGAAYILVQKANSTDTWINIGGGEGTFTTLTVTGLSTLAAVTQHGTFNINPSGSSTTSIATGTSTGAVNIGTGSAKTITIGNNTGATTVGIYAGSGNINFNGATFATAAFTAGTTITATLGNITATNGNLALQTAGNKILIAGGSDASVGTSVAMTAGAVTVATTACSATTLIFYSRNTVGGTPGEVSITAQDGTGFTLTSSSNTETSTFNWWIINT